MTEFYTCGYGVRFALVTAYFIASILLMYVTAVSFYDRESRGRISLNIFITLAFIAITTAAAQSHYYSFRIGLYKLHIPAAVLAAILAAGILYAAAMLLRGHRARRHGVTAYTLREAIDNIPVGMTWFDEEGLPQLTNRRMMSLIMGMSGSDFQSADELRQIIDENRSENDGSLGDRAVLTLPDGRSYSYTEKPMQDGSGNNYTGAYLFDITELQEKKRELESQNESLREISEQLRYLNENAYKLAREEEILAFQTRLHDAMGAGISAVHRILEQNLSADAYDDAIRIWRRSAEMAYDDETDSETGSVRDFIADSRALGVRFSMDGEMPQDRLSEEVIMTALHTGLTNCIRHAGATEMHADIRETDGEIVTEITNNGRPPEGEIVIGGGITNLRTHAARAGGRVEVISGPEFVLRVILPAERKEKLL